MQRLTGVPSSISGGAGIEGQVGLKFQRHLSHYADAAQHNPTLPSCMLILP